MTAAVAVLLAGYVSLILFWNFGHSAAGLPGLFYYHDATWGDGLLLPLLALFLWVLIGRLPKPSSRMADVGCGQRGRRGGGAADSYLVG